MHLPGSDAEAPSAPRAGGISSTSRASTPRRSSSGGGATRARTPPAPAARRRARGGRAAAERRRCWAGRSGPGWCWSSHGAGRSRAARSTRRARHAGGGGTGARGTAPRGLRRWCWRRRWRAGRGCSFLARPSRSAARTSTSSATTPRSISLSLSLSLLPLSLSLSLSLSLPLPLSLSPSLSLCPPPPTPPERTPLAQIDALMCPVAVMHGELDEARPRPPPGAAIRGAHPAPSCPPPRRRRRPRACGWPGGAGKQRAQPVPARADQVRERAVDRGPTPSPACGRPPRGRSPPSGRRAPDTTTCLTGSATCTSSGSSSRSRRP